LGAISAIHRFRTLRNPPHRGLAYIAAAMLATPGTEEKTARWGGEGAVSPASRASAARGFAPFAAHGRRLTVASPVGVLLTLSLLFAVTLFEPRGLLRRARKINPSLGQGPTGLFAQPPGFQASKDRRKPTCWDACVR
jgi:hypothetical protein